MQSDDDYLIEPLFHLSDGEAYELLDVFALSWIFSAALASGLMLMAVNRFSLAAVAFSLALGGIWWTLSHVKRPR